MILDKRKQLKVTGQSSYTLIYTYQPILTCFLFVFGPKLLHNYVFLHCIVNRLLTDKTILRSESNCYRIIGKIGSGSTSTVYEAKTQENKIVVIKQVGIKIKSESQLITQNKNDDDLNIERHIYNKLNQFHSNSKNDCNKISCTMYDYFTNQDFEYLVLEKLGISLQHLLFAKNDSKFDLNTVCTLFDFMIVNLYKLHSIGFVHNDLKLENILIGTDSNKNLEKIYVVDFGISSRYYDCVQQKHMSLRDGVPFKGTFRFASQNHHCRSLSQSRRDDLESLIYLCIFCLTNDLPWIIKYDSNTRSKKETIFQKSKDIKAKSSISAICAKVPNQFNTALEYVRSLGYDEMPNYRHLQNLFQQLHSTIMMVSIEWDIYNLSNQSGYHFLGSHTIRNNESDHKEFENDFHDNNHNDDRNRNIFNCKISNKNIKHQNNAIISKFNEEVNKPNATMTNMMLQTQLTVCNHEIKLKNRFGYVIDRLVIEEGVPKSKSIESDYSGIIIYEPIDKKTVYGKLYMLEVSKCEIINDNYFRKYNKLLNGQIHGAVYYHYFKQNIHTCDENEAIHERRLIRGFSLKSNGTFIFRSVHLI